MPFGVHNFERIYVNRDTHTRQKLGKNVTTKILPAKFYQFFNMTVTLYRVIIFCLSGLYFRYRIV